MFKEANLEKFYGTLEYELGSKRASSILEKHVKTVEDPCNIQIDFKGIIEEFGENSSEYNAIINACKVSDRKILDYCGIKTS